MFRRFHSYFILLTSYFFLNPKSVHAQAAWTGRCVDKANPDVATIQGLECLFFNVISVVVTLAGLIFFVMFIIGGFQYIISSGDPKKAAGASATLTHSFIGLVGVIGSWLILRLIYNFTGVNVTLFRIPG